MADYLRPSTLQDAVLIAGREGMRLAAGCTDLFPATAGQTLGGPILDLTAIDALTGISRSANGWRIGAATTWAALQRAELPAAFDGLKAAAKDVGSVQIQTAGTIGGNLCNASPAADGVPPLLTLNAEVELASLAGSRRLGLGEFLTGPRKTALRTGEILTAIHVPQVGGQGGFLKLGARRYLVISIAMVAARIGTENGIVTEAALAVGACSPVAVRLAAQEAALLGAPLATLGERIRADLVAPYLSPIPDIRADATYRAGSATELLRRVVLACCSKAGKP